MGFLDPGEAHIQSLVLERKSLMVDSQQVENRCVEISNVDGFLDDVVAEVVGRSMHGAATDAAACHPDAEASWVVIPTVVGLRQPALAVDRSPELSTPDDERIVEHAAHFQILHEGPARLVHIAALQWQVAGEVPVLVPTAVEDLGESHTSLGHAPGEKTVVGESSGSGHVGTIHIEDVARFRGEIRELGHG